MVATVWTVGHSDQELESFLALLAGKGVTAVADLRSQPYSRHAPHFSKQELHEALRSVGLGYVFLGRELGGRTEESALLTDGRVDFAKVAGSDAFCAGIERLRRGAETHRIAMLCAERDPLHCHRAILVSRHLHEAALDVHHIHSDGAVESHAALEQRMLAEHGLGREDLFTPYDTRLAQAYERQGERVAWRPA